MSEETCGSQLPAENGASKAARGALQIASVVPYVGGMLSAAAGYWSEREQDKVNKFFDQWLKMLEDELKEKAETIVEILARLDLHDENIKERIESPEYQSLIRKTFREWSGAESKEKRIYIRNILANAAATDLTVDDVIRLFIDWINTYSELHFKVVAAIYNNAGITRGGVWRSLGRDKVREDSAEADLYKLLFRDLSTGGIIRQCREKDYYGNFVKRPKSKGTGSSTITSAFDDEDQYELTQLGQQFVHYAMTDLPPKIDYSPSESAENKET